MSQVYIGLSLKTLMIFYLQKVDRPNWIIIGFRQAVIDTRLFDMEGYHFTWFKSLKLGHMSSSLKD